MVLEESNLAFFLVYFYCLCEIYIINEAERPSDSFCIVTSACGLSFSQRSGWIWVWDIFNRESILKASQGGREQDVSGSASCDCT